MDVIEFYNCCEEIPRLSGLIAVGIFSPKSVSLDTEVQYNSSFTNKQKQMSSKVETGDVDGQLVSQELKTFNFREISFKTKRIACGIGV